MYPVDIIVAMGSSKNHGTLRLCFVCLGNICRSPTAEGIMRTLVSQEGLDGHIDVESAGTGTWHLGEPADSRARETAKARGVTLDRRAQQFTRESFDRFDYVLVMDEDIQKTIRRLSPSREDQEKVHVLRDFDPASPKSSRVPDPYYGGPEGFEDVFDICDAACRGLLAHLRASHALPDAASPRTRH
jgi:protein-tyrosine phosphatase